jgi:hypothetical protein
VENKYDIFGVMPDGCAVWRFRRAGSLTLGTAEITILEFGKKSSSDFFVMHLPSKEGIARVNMQTAP